MMFSSRIGLLTVVAALLAATTRCHNLSTDRSSIAALKSYVTSDPKNILKDGWSDSTFVCNWTGVTCGTDPVRVVGLNLSFAGLVGTVPPHLGNLSFLVELHFLNNSFHGVLPDELSRLRQLKNLNFGYNDLSGGIPSWLGSLLKLGSLWLHGNQFSGSIPISIFNLTSLEIVALGDNQLSGNIPDEIGRLPYLENFQVHMNAFKGPFPQFVFNTSSLKILSLSYNIFEETSLPDNICQNLPNIEELYLHQNNLIGRIPSKLSACKQLRLLSFSDNNLQGDLPKSIANLTRAERIVLRRNKLTGTIPEDIGNLHNLEYLSLSVNNISGTIPHTLFNITTMRGISLSSLKLSGGLPLDFGLWVPNLEELYLGINNLGGQFPESISNASRLRRLDISFNHFSGFITNTLRALNKLELLNLGDNVLTLTKSTDNILHTFPSLSHLKIFVPADNPLDTTLPSSVGSNISDSLELLHLYRCKLRGPIPDSLANFSSLMLLNLWGNQFSGSIPPSIGMLQKLQALDLSTNLLDRAIPLELCQLRFLSSLNLGNNMLSGSIPWCLGRITSLRVLYLGSNKLSSAIPPTIWGNSDLIEVNFSSNSLTGSLSSDIGKLKALNYFSVSSNQLSGNISSSIGNLQSLKSLNLGNNNFRGSIPDSIGNMLSLEFLDLSNNSLSGAIPKTFEKLLDLTFLNLSNNKLSGEIPSRGRFSNFSALSFIQNTNLCGAPRLQVPPCKSGPRKAKKALILRYVIPSVVCVPVLFIMTFLIIAFRRKNSRKPDSETAPVTLRRFSPFELSTATNGFKEENLLGVGGFGSVYKGIFPDGMVVAIKVFNLQLEEAFENFASECQVLCNVRHRNLVKVITCCSSPDFKALVLQYMPQGTLDKWLYSEGLFLNLLQRLNAMIDVASALEYLHYGYSTPVVHCDLKPSNVLLDENMVAHVADFGIARLLSGEDSITQTLTLATIGYMAPEYGVGGGVSRRGDVYSFGIMLMEVFTKKKPTDDMFGEEMNLKQWVQNSIQNEEIDSDLLRPEDSDFIDNKDCVTSILELSLTCTASIPEERIDMKIAFSELNKMKNKFLSNA